MIQIILTASVATMERAKAAGFTEKTVLVKHNGVESTEKNKQHLEQECRDLGPFQFLVSDYWGMTAD